MVDRRDPRIGPIVALAQSSEAVLTLTIDRTDPHSAAGVRRDLMALAGTLHALEVDLERHGEHALDALIEDADAARYRAAYVPIDGLAVRRFSSNLPLPCGVRFAPRPALRPLVRALSLAPPIGLIAVASDEIRVVSATDRGLHRVVVVPAEPDSEDWREQRARSRGQTLRGYQSSLQSEKFERRVGANHARALRELSQHLPALAASHGWRGLVVLGDPRDTPVLTEWLSGELPPVTFSPLIVEWLSESAELARAVAAPLAEARRLFTESVLTAISEPSSHGRGVAIGSDATVAVLSEERVAQLVVDDELSLVGWRAPDGRLALESVTLPGSDASLMVPEADLVEAMIGKAFEQDAAVTILPAGTLAAGAAALLRW